MTIFNRKFDLVSRYFYWSKVKIFLRSFIINLKILKNELTQKCIFMEILNCRQIYIYLNRLDSIQFILRNLLTFEMLYFYLVFFSIHIHNFNY